MEWLNGIIRFSIKNRMLVLLGAILVVLGGIFTAGKMDIDVFPDLTAPTVVIMTDCHGMAAEEVERLVSFPIETAVNGATNVRRVRSSSMFGYSFVWVEFDWGMDVFRARQIVSEKMVTLSEELPADMSPVLAPQSSVMGEILFIGLQAETTSMMDLRTIAEWVVKPSILATGGVSQVTIIGGDYKEYQILADPLKMNAFGVTMEEVEQAGRTLSVNSEGGVVRDYGNEYALRGMARTTDLEDLGKTVVKYENGKSIVLSDVAELVMGSAVKMGHASQNASPAVIVSVSKQPNINTLKVTKAIEKNLESVAQSLPSDVKLDTKIFRQADFISASVGNVGEALLEGALFVIIVLFLFLGSFRTTLVSIIAIPVSLLGTIIVLYLLGMDINTMTLGGMCIAIGSLVDDAIIDVENVYKRLRQNHARPKEEREDVLEVVYQGSSEIRSSVINATLIIMVAFIPLFFLSGMEGRLLKPLGITYIISLFMSLLVAMTLTPLLCRVMLTDDKYLTRNEKDSRITAFLNGIYHKALAWVLDHKKTAVGSVLALFVAALLVFMSMGSAFLPDFNEGSATIAAITDPGVSLDVSHELGNLMEKTLLEIPEVKTTSRRTGRGELDEHSQSTNAAELDVTFDLGKKKKDELFDEMRQRLTALPGVVVTIGQPLGHRIDHMLSGTQAAIAIKIFGTDLSRLLMMGNSIKACTEGIEGLVDVSVEQQTATPQLHIVANRDALAKYGIKIGDFNEFVSLAFSGEKLSDIYEGQRRFDVVLRLAPEYTQSIEGIRNALIDTPDGSKVPLSAVADIISTSGPNTISRENVQRKLVVSANVSGRDVGSVVEDIKAAVAANVELPEGYRIEYGGQFESARTASRTLALATVLAIFVVFLLLYGQFKNVSLSAIFLINLPLALIGGVFAVWVSSGVVSIPSIIGFITLFGVAVRNGVLLISRYEALQGLGYSLKDSIMMGSVDRLNPILMTALTSALALIPLVLSGDKSGNEIQSPMAIVVLGGLVTSTLLNIFIMPIMFEWFSKLKSKKEAKDEN
ncbi:MAG: efflux RND transporter permease subunit [Bacteroidales bacterium]|nr:efflux RND transporter permease subunit [Bacteroidales bacterium]